MDIDINGGVGILLLEMRKPPYRGKQRGNDDARNV
jgi:hypothetical protein